MDSSFKLVLLVGLVCVTLTTVSGHVSIHITHDGDDPPLISTEGDDRQDMTVLQDLVIELREEVRSLKKEKDLVQGSVYVRWGKHTCPGNDHTEFVYNGYMAGSRYNTEVGTSSYLCLPRNVTWGMFHNGVDPERAYLFGTEMDLFNSDTILDKPNILNQNAPCAVCKVRRSATVMIPARTDCFQTWSLEYAGYLVSNYKGGSISTEAVCLDGDPDFVNGGEENNNESIVHFVEARCGALPCPPYVDGRELACVVCSK